MLFLYIRHGNPIYSPDSLTELGHKQAEALKHRLKLAGIDEIYASSSTRAIMTATPTAEMLDLPIIKLDWCHEDLAAKDFFHENNGKSRWCFDDEETASLFNSPEVRALDRDWYDHPAFAGRNYKKGYQRVARETDAFFESLGYRHRPELNGYEAINPSEKCVALFAHAGFGLLFLSNVLDIPYPLYSTRFTIGHTGVTAIQFDVDKKIVYPRVLQHSGDSHLFAAGLPTDY